MNFSKPWIKHLYYGLLILMAIVLFQPKGGTWAWVDNIRWLYVFFLAFIIAQLITPVAIKLAWKLNILDRPDCDRKLQCNPTPRIGGLAIFGAVLLSTARNFQFSPELTGLVLGSSIIYILGFIDDAHPLPAMARLVVQLLAGYIVIRSGVYITVVPDAIPGHYLMNATLTMLWLIGISNAVNFMDGVDGLCTSMMATAAILLFLVAWRTRQSYLAYLTISVAGGCLGFLPHNWKRAKVYLGDAGSTFLGFLVAGLCIMQSWAHDNPLVAVASPLLILGIPIFDMIYTTIARIKKGQVHNFKEWLEYAGRDHFHHRLMSLSFSETQTVLFIIMVNLTLGMSALVIRNAGPIGSLILLTQAVIVFLIISMVMIRGQRAADLNEKLEQNRDIV